MTPIATAQCAVAVLGCLLFVATVSRSRLGLVLCVLSASATAAAALVLLN